MFSSMKIYRVLLGDSLTLECQLKEFEIEAASADDAKVAACISSPGWVIHDCVIKRNPWGGARAGAGQPAKYGEKTKVIRVPESVADKRDLIAAIPELIELLNELEQDCENNPQSARRYFLHQALQDIRNLGF